MDNSINKIFVKAFNQGYLLAKHNPTIIEKVLLHKNNGIYFEGFVTGKKINDQERKISRIDEIEKLRLNKEKDRDLKQ